MSDLKINNKLIVKNTIFLYVRMLFSMAVSLYTARVVLNTLGASDFGLYNVVGGIIAFFSIVKSLMSTGTQRFLTYELGNNSNTNRVRNVFTTSLTIFCILGVIIILLGETIGLWFINNYINIPEGRETAANVVFHVSIVTMLISVIQLPYTAAIFAHERMDIYGYAGVIEPVLRLIFILCLPYMPFDKLIVYSFIILFISIIITAIYITSCKKMFFECKFELHIDRLLFKQMVGFTIWNLLESLSNLLSNQGHDILLNKYFGTTTNASRAVAIQANNAVHGFASNFIVAMYPQITKSYASGNMAGYYSLMIRGAKFSFILLAIIMMPIMLNTEYLLNLWLKKSPVGTDLFCRLLMIATILRMISEPLYTGIQSTGSIRKYQIVTSIMTLANLPICFLLFKMSFPVYTIFIVNIAMSLVIVMSRLYFVKVLTNFPVLDFANALSVKCLLPTIITFGVLYFINQFLVLTIGTFLLISVFSVVICIATFYIVSFSNNEKQFVVQLIRNKLNK